MGLPHSGHSPGVSGSVSSSIVLSTSTNGTSATTAPHSSGSLLAPAPTHAPPAERHLGAHPAPRPRTPVGDGAHQLAPRRAALDGDVPRSGEPGVDQPL